MPRLPESDLLLPEREAVFSAASRFTSPSALRQALVPALMSLPRIRMPLSLSLPLAVSIACAASTCSLLG